MGARFISHSNVALILGLRWVEMTAMLHWP